MRVMKWIAVILSVLAITNVTCAGAATPVQDLGTAPSGVPNEDAALMSKAPGVIVSFEGGVVGNDLARVLKTLAGQNTKANVLPSKRYVVQRGESVCSIIDKLGYPPPCEKLIEVFVEMNPRLLSSGRSVLKPGESLSVPDIHISEYAASKAVSGDNLADVKRQAQIVRNWGALDPLVTTTSSETARVDYKAYEIFIAMPTDEAARNAETQILKSSNSANVLVDVLVQRRKKGEQLYNTNSLSAETFKQTCSDGSALKATVSYADYFEPDPDATQVVMMPSSTSIAKVTVYIIDTQVVESPNLYPAFGANKPTLPWVCRYRTDIPESAHATHLASIVASQGNGFGFLGLAPFASVKSINWVAVDSAGKLIPASESRDIDLARLIGTAEKGGLPLNVYLAAADWNLPNSAGTPLTNSDDRFRRRLPKTVHDVRPLIIAAAGQSESPAPPLALSTLSSVYPQNLGDLENVVVVSACSNCGRASPKLMDGVWYSTPDQRLVHVAAPGGMAVPGWVNADSVGAFHGTSQAAAFVAGIAAKMIGVYPDSYVQPKLIKTRIQVTSWPIPPTDTGPADGDKVATGIVDPLLALLNPEQHWIKEGGLWRSVKIKKLFPNQFVFRDTNGFDQNQGNGAVYRIVSQRSNATGSNWTIYSDPNQTGPAHLGDVQRQYVASWKADTPQLVLCDGTAKPIPILDDVIIALRGVRDDEC